MSKTKHAVRLAHRKGYRVTEEGTVVNALDQPRKCQIKHRLGDARYVFSINVGYGSKYPVPVHQLQAFQLFGDAMFEPGVVVRHLDGDAFNNRPSNIALGTVRDNIMDRPEENRKEHAAKATAANPGVRKDWDQIEADHAAGLGFKKLSQKYGISTGTLSTHFNKKKGWKPLTPAKIDVEKLRLHILKTGCSYAEAAVEFGISTRSITRLLGGRKAFRSIAQR